MCRSVTSLQAELHRKLVERYSEKCGGKFSSLPDDSYVHDKLVGHVAAAGRSLCVIVHR